MEGRMLSSFKWPEALYWLIPVAFGAVVEVMFSVPFVDAGMINRHREILFVLIPFCIIAPLGGWWAVHQCIRRETHPAKYLAIVILVPLGFTWYYFERHRPARGSMLIADRH
jgi:hypothetical protein